MPEFGIVRQDHLKRAVDLPASLTLPDLASQYVSPKGFILAKEVKMVSGDIESAHVWRTAESDQGALDVPGFKDAFRARDLGKGTVRRSLPGNAPCPDHGKIPIDPDRPKVIHRSHAGIEPPLEC